MVVEVGSAVMNMVMLALGGRTYALHIEHVTEVLRMVAITPLPDAPDPVLGVINLRGRAVPVVSLARRVGVEAPPYHPDTFLVVLSHGEKVMAVPVERVVAVQDVVPEDVEPSPVDGSTTPLIGGVISREDEQILVLDPVVLFDAGLADAVPAPGGDPSADAVGAAREMRRSV